jgi:predicted ribosomally synthesized peptide with nif11-like leader
MSEKAAAEFVAMAAANPAITEKVRSEGESLSDERFNQVIKVAAEEGFEFTVEELRSVMSTAEESQEGELTDEQLETVAGGMATWQVWLGKAWSLVNGGGDDGGGTHATGPRG